MAQTVSGDSQTRDSFTSRTAFIIACIGSAVGLSGIWLFPYRVSQLGGAAFLIPYLFFVVLLGLTGVVGEMSFGRAMGCGPMGAFGKALELRGVPHATRIGKAIGIVPVLAALGIAIGYTVVLGWFLKYLFAAATGTLLTQPDMGAYFGQITGDFGSIGWHAAALIITLAVMVLGISRGIERLNKIMMPLFFVLFCVLLVRVAMLPGAIDGYAYLFMPRWEALANPQTWVLALGQAFFGLSLAGGGTLVYGSYLQNHASHLFVFAAPDFLDMASVFPLAKTNPELFDQALGLKSLGNQLCNRVGGRSIHPITAVVGGFTHEPTRDEYLAMADKLDAEREFARAVVDLFNGFTVPDIATQGDMMAMVAEGRYPVADSRWARFLDAGVTFDADRACEQVEEYEVSHSAALFARCRQTGKTYFTGALARINASWGALSQEAKVAAAKAGLRPPERNPFLNNVAQAVEVLDALGRCADLCRKLAEPDGPFEGCSTPVPFEVRSTVASWKIMSLPSFVI